MLFREFSGLIGNPSAVDGSLFLLTTAWCDVLWVRFCGRVRRCRHSIERKRLLWAQLPGHGFSPFGNIWQNEKGVVGDKGLEPLTSRV